MNAHVPEQNSAWVDSPHQNTQFFTVKQVAKRHPAFSEGSLRWAIFNRRLNGFDSCLIRIGRRLLIDEQRFLEWVEHHREGSRV
jgi:hypothetical protein